jgi:type III pantothenate kinase
LILLIDIGNTCIKWATLEGEVIVSTSHCKYSVSGIALDCFNDMVTSPTEIYMISVGSDVVEHNVGEMCRQRWDITPTRLHTDSYCAGVSNGYDNPLSLGVDRWAAMIGAYQLVGEAILVIDCGTACSADVLNQHGQHLGGAIIPGFRLMEQSLRAGTARIDVTADAHRVSGLGTTTTACIALGMAEAVFGFIAGIERLAIARIGDRLTVVITGGDAPVQVPLLQSEIRYEKELIFLGMAAMVREKRGDLFP